MLMLLSALLVVAGCDAAHMAAYTPVDEKTSIPAKALFDASVASLEEVGYNLDKQDPASFQITTVQRTHNVSELSQTRYHYSWNVSTADGRLAIKLTCEISSGTHAARFKPCGDEAPQHLIHEQQKIHDAILKRAKGG